MNIKKIIREEVDDFDWIKKGTRPMGIADDECLDELESRLKKIFPEVKIERELTWETGNTILGGDLRLVISIRHSNTYRTITHRGLTIKCSISEKGFGYTWGPFYDTYADADNEPVGGDAFYSNGGTFEDLLAGLKYEGLTENGEPWVYEDD